MNKDNIEQYWPLLEALRSGKTIQCQLFGVCGGEWVDLPNVNFSPAHCYRVKPEPPPKAEVWIAYRPYPRMPQIEETIFVTEDNKDNPYWKKNGFTVRKFVEVME